MCSNQEKIKPESKIEADVRELKRELAILNSRVTEFIELCKFLEKHIKGTGK